VSNRKYRVEFSVTVKGWFESSDKDLVDGGENLSRATIRKRLAKEWNPMRMSRHVEHNCVEDTLSGREYAQQCREIYVPCDIGTIEEQKFTRLRMTPISSPLQQLAEQAE
jgi:hypothetical protein